MKKTLLTSLVMFLFIFMAGTAQITTDGLVGHWKFEEGTGTAVSDELGNTNGELVNSVEGTWGTGYWGTGLDFSQTDGNPAYARFPGDGAADLTESFTIMCWIKVDVTVEHEQSFFSKGVPFLETGGEDGGWVHISVKENAVRTMIWDTDQLPSPAGNPVSPLEPTEWYFITSVRDVTSGMVHTYIDGELLPGEDGTVADITALGLHNNEDLTFGSVATGVNNAAPDGTNFWDSNFLGMLDEVQLYNVALSGEQIKAIYDAYENSTSIDDNLVKNLILAPNVVNNRLEVRNASELTKLEVYTLTGQMVKSINTSRASVVSEDISDLSRGTYIVRGYQIDNSVVAAKFIKQ